MSHIWISVPLMAVWLVAGLVFISLCRAASRADEHADKTGLPRGPRTLRQHIFAVRARSLRAMRRGSGAVGTPGTRHSVRSGAARNHAGHSGLHSA